MSRNRSQKAKYAATLAKAVCVRCFHAPSVPGKSRCAECARKENIISKRVRASLIENGLCVRCRKPTSGRIQCDKCYLQQKEQRKRDKLAEKCALCSRKTVGGQTRCQHHINLVKKYNKKLKDEVFEFYGGYVCKCCGEKIKEFLVIDHINGGGTKHGLQTGDGTNFYRWLKQNNFPSGFQVLCCNCNWGKKICGECPHKLEDD